MKRILALFALFIASPVLAQQSIHILVLNQSGGPIAGASVTVFESDGAQVGSAFADADGRVEIDGVNPSGQFSARVTALNYIMFAGPLSFPENGRNRNDPVNIVLSRTRTLPGAIVRPDPDPEPEPTANQTIIMDEAFFADTLAAGWRHSAIGSTWLRRCQLFPGGTGVIPAGWVMRGGSHIWAWFGSDLCTFRLFEGRGLNPPWTFVSFSVVDGRDSGVCPPSLNVSVTTTPTAGSTEIPLVVELTAAWDECHAAVTSITVNGPEDANPMEAFEP